MINLTNEIIIKDVKNIKKEFIKQLKNDGVKNFTEIIGQDTSSKFWEKRK